MNSPSCRTAILISGSGTNLQAFIDAVDSEGLPLELIAVVSNVSTAYGLERARRAGIQTIVIDHREFASREAFDREIISALDPLRPELLILAGFMRILSADFVRHYRGRILNIHPALLPKYPGLDTHARAIKAGDAEHGSTVHVVTEELDGGPRLLQGKLAIRPDDTPESLAKRVQKIEHRIYPLAAGWFAERRVSVSEAGIALDGESLKEPVVMDFSGETPD